MKAANFENKIISQKGNLIHKLIAIDENGKEALYYILVEPMHEAAFIKKIESGEGMDFTDYGKVIGSCYGNKPTEQLKKELKENYGFEA